jgi:hypothetical protein
MIQRFGCWLHPRTPWSALDYLELPAARGLAPLGQFVSLVGLVSPNFLQAWNKVGQSCQKAACAKCIVHVGRRDVEGEWQAQRIYQQMALATFNGLITNDKFCLTRHISLRLTWSRSPLRIATQASATYLPGENAHVRAHRGGGHETAMAYPSPGAAPVGRATTVGPRLPTPAGLDDAERVPECVRPRDPCDGESLCGPPGLDGPRSRCGSFV